MTRFIESWSVIEIVTIINPIKYQTPLIGGYCVAILEEVV